jgi:hypothetical protein
MKNSKMNGDSSGGLSMAGAGSFSHGSTVVESFVIGAFIWGLYTATVTNTPATPWGSGHFSFRPVGFVGDVERAGAGAYISYLKKLQKSAFFVSEKQNVFRGSCKIEGMQTNCICRPTTFHRNAAKTTRACFQMDLGTRVCGPQQRRPRHASLFRRNRIKTEAQRRRVLRNSQTDRHEHTLTQIFNPQISKIDTD